MVRPKKPAGEVKTIVIPVRFTIEQRDQLKLAADAQHLAVSTWVHQAALEVAKRVNVRAAKKAK